MEAFVWIKVLELSPQLPDFPVDEEEVQTGRKQHRKETAVSERDGAGSQHPLQGHAQMT